MKNATLPILGITLAGMLAVIVLPARADTFGSGGNAFTIDFVTIGNPGNADDAGAGGGLYSTPYGGVAYEFRMGVYEVSEDLIVKANAMGGLGIGKDTRGANKPVTGVLWNAAARFVNWLNTSRGYQAAYKFDLEPCDPSYDVRANILLWEPADYGYNSLYGTS